MSVEDNRVADEDDTPLLEGNRNAHMHRRGRLWLGGRAGRLGSSGQHVEVSLGKMLNLKLLPKL